MAGLIPDGSPRIRSAQKSSGERPSALTLPLMNSLPLGRSPRLRNLGVRACLIPSRISPGVVGAGTGGAAIVGSAGGGAAIIVAGGPIIVG